jgi:hypothetical protein
MAVQMLEEPDTNATDGSVRPKARQISAAHDTRKDCHAMSAFPAALIPSRLPRAEIREYL